MLISSDSLAKASTSPVKTAAQATATTTVFGKNTAPEIPPSAAHEAAVDSAQLKQHVEQLNRFVAGRNAQIEFQVDESSARVITKIIDSKTREVIRQIPNEEVLRISQAIGSALNHETAPVLISAVA